MKNGMRNGYGKFYYNQGSVYDGNWKDNLMHGKGSLFYSNGKLVYEG
jgi:antitoxin component YwqK of YwqJK toxin-antitoxin module